jgi:cyclopropane fatty-acyl-phospholipid synthase-like methyltransferase
VRGDLESGPFPGDLEAAQRRKIHHVLTKARVKPGHRILEFGSGWGGLAIEVSIFYLGAPTVKLTSRVLGSSFIRL